MCNQIRLKVKGGSDATDTKRQIFFPIFLISRCVIRKLPKDVAFFGYEILGRPAFFRTDSGLIVLFGICDENPCLPADLFIATIGK